LRYRLSCLFPKMGRSAYWKGLADSLASTALGDANRGAFLALQSAVSTRRRLVATDPPERRASSCSEEARNDNRFLTAPGERRCYFGLRFGFAGLARIA